MGAGGEGGLSFGPEPWILVCSHMYGGQAFHCLMVQKLKAWYKRQLEWRWQSDRIGGGKESRHGTRVGQSYYKLACTVPTERFGLQLINAL